MATIIIDMVALLMSRRMLTAPLSFLITVTAIMVEGTRAITEATQAISEATTTLAVVMAWADFRDKVPTVEVRGQSEVLMAVAPIHEADRTAGAVSRSTSDAKPRKAIPA